MSNKKAIDRFGKFILFLFGAMALLLVGAYYLG
jgi:hypothetical protein